MASGILNIQETTEQLHRWGMKISPETVRFGIQQRVFPFGDCISGEKHPIFFVYEKLLNEWAAQHLTLTEERVSHEDLPAG